MSCKSVLIVEDDFDIRENLAELLILENYEVVLTQNGQEALTYLSKTKNMPDVILLDLMMPVMSGAEFLTTLRQELPRRAPQIPIIVLSAAGQSIQEEVIAVEIIRKPIDADQLLKSIEKYCGVPSPR